MGMNARLKELRSLLNLTQADMGKQLGLTATGISDIERGKTGGITEGNIKLICRTFHVNEEWLRTGEGNPLLNEYAHRQDLSDLEKDILTKYNLLDNADKQVVSAIIDRLYNTATKE